MIFLISWIIFFPLTAWNVGCYEYFVFTLPPMKTRSIWGQLGLVPDLLESLSVQGQQNPVEYGFHPSICAPILHRVCDFSLQQFPLSAGPAWQRGRAAVSAEEERFKLAQEWPPELCAGTSRSSPLEGTQLWCWGSCEGQHRAGTALLAGIWALCGSWAWITHNYPR